LGVEELHGTDSHLVFLSRFVAFAAANPRLRNNPSFGGIHFEKQSQRSGACQQGEAENQVAGRENSDFAGNVNGFAAEDGMKRGLCVAFPPDLMAKGTRAAVFWLSPRFNNR
jgi:hypothetical protein